MDWNLVWAAAGVIVAAAVPVGIHIFDRRRIDKHSTEFAVEGADWLFEKGMSYDGLLHRLIDIDYLSLAGTQISVRSEGTIQQWGPVFQKSPETWGLVVFRNSLIVGYWSIFSLSNKLMDRLKKGKLFDSQITADQVRSVSERGPHSLYCAMIARHPDFSNSGGQVFKLLLQSMSDQFALLQEEGLEIEGIYASAISAEGESLCIALGLVPIIEAEQSGRVFAGKVEQALMKRLGKFASRRPAKNSTN